MNLPKEYELWTTDSTLELFSQQRDFLRTALDAGFIPFTGPVGLIGAMSDSRKVLIIHRGRVKYWELSLYNDNEELASRFVLGISPTSSAALRWLSGAALDDVLNELGPATVDRPG